MFITTLSIPAVTVESSFVKISIFIGESMTSPFTMHNVVIVRINQNINVILTFCVGVHNIPVYTSIFYILRSLVTTLLRFTLI